MKKYIQKNMLLPEVALLLIVFAFIMSTPQEILTGFIEIQIHKSVLLTDYISVGGFGATFMNAAILMLLSFYIVKKLNMNITGAVFAGIMTIGGFAFFGKNVINVSIIFLGVYLYSLYKNISLRSIVVIFLFATGVAPISSVVIFGMGISLIYSIPLGILTGVVTGFLITEISAHSITFHRGYDLYNVGFAGGIIAVLFFSLLRIADLQYATEVLYTADYHIELTILLLLISIITFIAGFALNDFSFKKYQSILSKSGKAITDFTRNNNKPITLVNAGLTGLLVITVILLMQIRFSGPSAGAVFMVIGFAAFGKHIKNVLPSMIGVAIMALAFRYELSNITVTLAIIFSTALAPLAGEKGVLVGLLAGALHLPLLMNLSQLHGGTLLYSNGFAAGFTAVIVNSIVHTLERGEAYGNA